MRSVGGRRCRRGCGSPPSSTPRRSRRRYGGRRDGRHALRGGRWFPGCPGRPGASSCSILSLSSLQAIFRL
uniref:Uncharacterized protein n=1 Tax=Arundo donax TaxID=35708 RepID=A0A0A9FDB7_ARUDO